MTISRNKKVIITIVVLVIIGLGIILARNLQNHQLSKIHIGNSEVKKAETSEKAVSPESIALHKIQKTDIVLGNPNAKITVVEYASLSCPHCAVFETEGLPRLQKEYIDSGKVNYVYRDFPLNQPALIASMLGLCIAEDHKNDQVNKYYNFIKALFKTQDSWAFSKDFIENLRSIAKLDGMSSERFDACVKDAALQERVLKSRLHVSQTLQIQSTPTFIVNGQTINGYSGYDEIKKVIEKKLAELSAPTPIQTGSNPIKN